MVTEVTILSCTQRRDKTHDPRPYREQPRYSQGCTSALPLNYAIQGMLQLVVQMGCYNVLGIIVPHSPTGPTLLAAAAKVGTGKRIRNNNKGDCTS
jgi:hypothetical protein